MAEKENYQPLVVHSAVYKTTYTAKYEKRTKWEKPDEHQILSFIPGTVVELMVEEGQTVKGGTPLLILQAMKMNNKVLMPFDGKIAKIYVTIGKKIPKGTLMIELEK